MKNWKPCVTIGRDLRGEVRVLVGAEKSLVEQRELLKDLTTANGVATIGGKSVQLDRAAILVPFDKRRKFKPVADVAKPKAAPKAKG